MLLWSNVQEAFCSVVKRSSSTNDGQNFLTPVLAVTTVHMGVSIPYTRPHVISNPKADVINTEANEVSLIAQFLLAHLHAAAQLPNFTTSYYYTRIPVPLSLFHSHVGPQNGCNLMFLSTGIFNVAASSFSETYLKFSTVMTK